jgi:hypothetical protein
MLIALSSARTFIVAIAVTALLAGGLELHACARGFESCLARGCRSEVAAALRDGNPPADAVHSGAVARLRHHADSRNRPSHLGVFSAAVGRPDERADVLERGANAVRRAAPSLTSAGRSPPLPPSARS